MSLLWPLDGDKAIGIATVQAFLDIVLLFTANEAPNFIALHILNRNRMNLRL